MNEVITKRVYVPNRGTHDYSDAWKFGDLVFCTDGALNRKDLKTMHSELARAMQDSTAEDYILMTSLSSLCSIACSLFVFWHGRLNILLFEDGQYIEKTLKFD